jgi:hypothetical protein
VKLTLKFQSSIGPGLLQKFKIAEIILEVSKISKYAKIRAGGAPALHVPRAETWLTVYRSLPSLTRRAGACCLTEQLPGHENSIVIKTKHEGKRRAEAGARRWP